MGNNRSSLVSGSTATTASLNSTSSLPCNPNQQATTLQATSATPPSQSSVSFLKRFRSHHPSSQNFEELDSTDSQKKKNLKTSNVYKKKKQPNEVSTGEAKKLNGRSKKLEKSKIISMSASNIISKNESEYTSINECLDEGSLKATTVNNNENLPITNKVESYYESTLDMDLTNNNVKQTSQVQPKKIVHRKSVPNKENFEFPDISKQASTQPDSTANLYSEIINKHPSTKASVMPPPLPPPLNKKNHLQPITNFFNKLTKTTKVSEPLDISPDSAPTVPAKAFNPSKEFYSDVIPTIQSCEEFEEYDEDDNGIYSKIDKPTHLSSEEKNSLPPLPTTLVPTSSLNEEVEACLNVDRVLHGNEYQSMQEYELINPEASPVRTKRDLPMYTTIEPLNINNQVYYSFTSDSQELFDFQNELQNDYISRVNVKNNEEHYDRTYIRVDNSQTNIKPSLTSKVSRDLNLINEIESSRNQNDVLSHVTVKF